MAPKAPLSLASELGSGDEEELELFGLLLAAVNADVVAAGSSFIVTVLGCKIVEVEFELGICGLLLTAAEGGFQSDRDRLQDSRGGARARSLTRTR